MRLRQPLRLDNFLLHMQQKVVQVLATSRLFCVVRVRYCIQSRIVRT